MLCKDWQCLRPSPLQYTIYYEKSAVFSPCSHTSRWYISDWSCETKKVNLYKTLDLRWRVFCLRKNFHAFSYFSLFIFSSFCSTKHLMFYLINKHPHRCHRLTSAGRSFITCDVTTDDSASLYVYVTIYAAIHCKGRSGCAPKFNPSALLLIVDCSCVMGS